MDKKRGEIEPTAETDTDRTRFGERPRYAEGLCHLRDNVYSWMLPNGCWHESNAGLIVGQGASLLVDTQCDLHLTAQMLRALEPMTREAPIRFLFNTHADCDHIWGNQLLGGVEIVMTVAGDLECGDTKPIMLRLLGRAGMVLRWLPSGQARRVGDYFRKMVAPYDFRHIHIRRATRTFQGQLVLDVGGREVRLIEVGPAHTRGDALLHAPDAKTVFCGDVLFVGSTPVMWAGPVENLIAALQRILELDVEMIVPGHGPVCDKQAVLDVRQYWEYLRRETSVRWERGLSAVEAARDIVLSDDFAQQVFARWDSSERIMTNVYAMYRHLNRKPGHLKITEKLSILRQQALLAYDLPDAAPASMHRLEETP